MTIKETKIKTKEKRDSIRGRKRRLSSPSPVEEKEEEEESASSLPLPLLTYLPFPRSTSSSFSFLLILILFLRFLFLLSLCLTVTNPWTIKEDSQRMNAFYFLLSHTRARGIHWRQNCFHFVSFLGIIIKDVPKPFCTGPKLLPPFLDATTHLYKRSCQSVRPSVRPSVGPSVRPVLFLNDEYGCFWG